MKGDPGDSLYLIQDGKVAIILSDSTGKEITVAQRGKGESVGEIALLTGDKRTAKVCATTRSKVLRLSKSTFDNLTHLSIFLTKPIQYQWHMISYGTTNFSNFNFFSI